MQGNGEFCTTERSSQPVKLELLGSGDGFVNLIAALGNLRICIACFRNGMCDFTVINKDTAAKMGIQLNNAGQILQAG